MYLKKLNLLNFRNYETLEIEFKKKKNIIVGENAQGKTNLIESIFYLATLDSPRTSNDEDFVKWEKKNTLIHGVVEKSNGFVAELDVIINPGSPKTLKVNKIKKNVYNQFLGQLMAVSFSTTDLLLLRGTPKDRRTWIDNAICQVYPAYYSRMQNFNKVRQQKLSLLKSFNGYSNNLSSVQKNMLESWNVQIATSGSNIIYLRQKYLKEIYPFAQAKTMEISGERDDIRIVYDSSLYYSYDVAKEEIPSLENIKEKYDKLLENLMEKEIQKAQLLVGPHRDDVVFYINDKEAKAFASQGQQRTIVLSLKLSEFSLIKQVFDEEPVLLLDDVFAELDIQRQKYLFETIGNIDQTIVTTTDIDSFEQEWLKDVDIFKVRKGVIVND